ncbi:MAG TPA: DUF2950 family protein [Planctomycetota bacterium]
MKLEGRHRTAGFTLIELMIVVAIIAIIAAIAIPSLLRSRMAANETAAAAACKAFAEAEEIYHRTDYNRDGVLEYCQHLSGNDSLLETSSGSGDLALIDKNFAHAEGTVPAGGVPKAGYVFTILTRQGAPLRTINYVVKNRMTLGYGLCTIPASYDGTGRNSFLIGNTGTIYQKDRGVIGTSFMSLFNPNSTWMVTE